MKFKQLPDDADVQKCNILLPGFLNNAKTGQVLAVKRPTLERNLGMGMRRC